MSKKGEANMNRASCFAVALSLMLVGPLMVWAQPPTHIEFDFSGTGNLMVSPVVYTGPIVGGEPLLVGGLWDLNIDDTDWPPDTDKPTRWDYINATYFAPNYDPLYFMWVGTFDQNTTASALTWHAQNGPNMLHGTAVLQVTMYDMDMDGVIDPDERAMSVFSGTLIVVKDGGGVWAGYCGLGSFSGTSTNPDPANWADDEVSGHTILDVEDCSVPNEQITWGHLKQIYQD